jgi:hypothetical protein
MISREKVINILRHLDAHRGRTLWNAIDTEGGCPTAFYVTFPTSTLYFRYHAPPAEFDYVELEIQNKSGVIVAHEVIDEEDKNWEWVKRLFDDIERQVTGSDRVLEEIEGALFRSAGEIGIRGTV